MKGSESSNSDSDAADIDEEEDEEEEEEGGEEEEEEEKDSFFCEDCDFTTSRKYHLNRHLESVHGDTCYPCDICDYKAKRKDNLKKHKQSIHGIGLEAQKKTKKKSKSSKKSKTISPSPEPFYGFESPDKYKNKSTASLYEPFDKIIPDQNNSGFVCKFCKYIYPKRKALIIHMQEAHAKNLTEEQKNLEVIFACTHCDKAFHSKFLQKVHIKAHLKIESSGGKCDNYYHYYHSAGVWSYDHMGLGFDFILVCI